MRASECVSEDSTDAARGYRESPVVEAARFRLRASPYPPVRRIECSLVHGRLRLHGKVRSYFHKQLAQETVARLAGVTQVLNEIEVGDWG